MKSKGRAAAELNRSELVNAGGVGGDGKKVSSLQMMRRCRYKAGANTKVNTNSIGIEAQGKKENVE